MNELELSELLPLQAPDALDAERQMLLEMLADAIRCWQGTVTIGLKNGEYYFTSRQRLAAEAGFWIFGAYDNRPWFSFAQVCHWLELDPDFIRRKLLEGRGVPYQNGSATAG